VVEVEREGGRPLCLSFLPVAPSHRVRGEVAPRARAIVVVHDPEAEVRLRPELIARIHGLTPTEAALAAAIASGRTAAEIAAERGSSEHTVRTHLKRILDKTGTTRQADLVRLLLASAALQMHEAG